MAVNPLIAMSGRAPTPDKTFSNILLDLGRIENIKQSQAEAPARQRLLEAQAGTAEAGVPTDEERFNKQNLEKVASVASISRSIIPDLQEGNTGVAIQKLQQRAQELDAAGIDSSNTVAAIELAQADPEQLLTSSINAVKEHERLSLGKKGVQFGAQQTFKDSEGNLFFGTTKRNPSTGQVDSVLSPVGGAPTEPVGGVNLVSGLGLTAQEKADIAAATAGAKEAAKLAEQAAARPEIEEKVQAAKTKAAKQESRQQLHMSEGLTAADNTANIRRGLELINQVPTGGISAVSLKAKQLFGIEGADEAELSARLGKAVLAQLRTTFGAAFTEREGARLENIEAGFGKSTEGNKRLLKQTLKIMERTARRGISAAEKAGDDFTAEEIRKALIFNLEEGTPGAERKAAVAGAQQQTQEGATATNPQTGQKVIFQNGQWQPAS